MDKIQASLFEAMKQFSDYAASSSRSTITIECEIQELLDEGQGLYKVGFQGNSFIVHAANTDISYNIGEKVYVLVPEGNYDKDKIIIGSTAPTAAQYATDTDESTHYNVSDNFIDLDLDIIKLSSYEDTYSSEIEITEGYNNKKILGEVLSRYISDYRTLSLSFSVQTFLTVTQQTSGNYGVTIGIPLIANKGGGEVEKITKYYTLDVGNMLGNPYRYTAWAPQHIYFDIDEQFTYDTDRVPTFSYFCYGFTHDDKKIDIKDIWLKDFSLNAVDTLTEKDRTGYTLLLTASEGEYFSEKYRKYKTLTPTLKVNNKKTSISKSAIYWFIEDASIKSDNKFFSPYGGFGWKCLNEKTNIAKADDGTETFTYITDEDTWSVSADEVEVATRYKCVVIYNDTSVSAIITLKNLESNKLIELESTTGSKAFIKDIGYIDLTTTVYAAGYTDSEDYRNSIVYSWMRYDKNGNYLLDTDDFFEVISYNKIVQKEINGLIKNCYQTRIKFPANMVEEYNLVFCSAYLITEKDDEINRTLIGTRSYAVNTIDDLNYLLTVNNGNKIFKYDSDGDSPTGEAYDGPAESKINSLEALTYNIYRLDGQELTSEEYYYCKYKWLIPVNSMITVDSKYLELDADEKPVITEDGFYISSGYGNSEGLPYEIAKRYNASKSNNTIILQVDFNGNKIENAIPMSFIKEGDSGTNGTGYAAVLVMGTSAVSGVTYGTRNSLGFAQKEKFVYNTNNKTWYYHDTSNNTLIDWNSRKRIYPRVYQNSELLTYEEDYTVRYSMFDNRVTNPCFNIQDVNSVGGVLFGVEQEPDINETYVNILQAEITVKRGNSSVLNANEKIYAYYPIELTICNFDAEVIPSMDGGFANVLFASDGTNPSWDETEDFICNDGNFLGEDLSEYFEIEWEAENHLLLPKLEKGVTRYLGSTMHIEPVNKYDDGNSKNYVKATLSFDETKENELLEKLIELDAESDKYKNKIQEEEDNLKYLKDFADKYTLNKWYSDLDSIQELLDKQTNAVYRLNNLLDNSIKNLENYLNLQQNYNDVNINRYCATLLTELSVLKIQAEYALVEIKKNNFSFNDLISLASDKLTWDEVIKQSLVDILGLDLALTLQLLIQDVNNQIDDYEISLKKLKSISGMSYENIYANIVNEIGAACDIIPDKAFNSNVILRDNVKTYLKQFNTLTSITDIKDCIQKMYDNVLCAIFKVNDNKLIINAATETSIKERMGESQSALDATAAQSEKIKKVLNAKDSVIVHLKPIVFIFNRYEMSNINGWDGNKLELGDSYLLAPQLGAGYKDPVKNTFTGLVMGVKTLDTISSVVSSNNKQTGLFGYSDGVRSLFLSADNGSAVFGRADKAGQIIVDPNSEKALLYSSNFFVSYNQQTGLPSSYSASNRSGRGMLIDLTTPEIRFGNGNFIVDSDGKMSAYSATLEGEIRASSGWIGNKDRHFEILADASKACIFSGPNSISSTKAGVYVGTDGIRVQTSRSDYFICDSSGNVEMSGRIEADRGQIGDWIIDDSGISNGETGSGRVKLSCSSDKIFQIGAYQSAPQDMTMAITKTGYVYCKGVFVNGEEIS